MATKYRNQDNQEEMAATPYSAAYAGMPSQVASEQQRVDSQRQQRDKMYGYLRDQGHSTDSARLMVDTHFAQNKTDVEQKNETNALAVNFVREGHDPIQAQQLAENTYGMQQKSMNIQNRWAALSIKQQNADLEDKQKELGEGERLHEATTTINSIPTTDLNRREKIDAITSQYPDLAASPRENIRGAWESILRTSHDVSQLNQTRQFTEAEKDGIPVKELGGIPEEVLTNGMYDKSKGEPWAIKHHSDKIALEIKQKVDEAAALQPGRVEMARQEGEARQAGAIKVTEARIAAEERAHPERAVKLRNESLMMASNLVKGIPLNYVGNEQELTKGKVKWYSAKRDKNGNLVADPTGDLRVYENKADKKNPMQIINKSDLEDAKALKESAVRPAAQATVPSTATPITTTGGTMAPSPVNAQAPEDQEAPVSTAEPSQYSSDNPYAQQATLEESTAKETMAKASAEKARLKGVVAWKKASDKEKQAQENLKDPSRLIPQFGEVSSEATPQELATAYELAKTQVSAARKERLKQEALNPEFANINLNQLQGQELEEFNNILDEEVLRPILKQAGGDKEKALQLAINQGYNF